MTKDLTRGNPLKLILSFCLPLMVGQFFQQLYNMVDTIIIGRFAGVDELAGVGATGPLTFFVVGFVSGISTGFSISMSQSFGAQKYKKMRKYFANSIYLTALFSVVLTAVTVLLARPILKLMNTPENIFEFSYTYISIIFMGLTATLFYNLFSTALRAVGDSITPLCLLIVASILNILLDLLFVVKFNMSVKGVAIATVIAQAVSAILAFVIIKTKYKILDIQRNEASFDPHMCGKLLYIGLPMALQFSITSVGSMMLQTAVNGLGETIVSAVTIAGKVQLMLILPAETIGITMTTYCGQNLGAKRIDRIQSGLRQSLLLAMIYCVIAIFIAKFLSDEMTLLFINKAEDDIATVTALVADFLNTCSWFYPILVILFIYRNALQGIGYSLPASLAGVFELFARGSMGYFVIPKFGFNAVCFTHPTAWFAADILLIPLYYFAFNKLKKQYPINSQSDNNITD